MLKLLIALGLVILTASHAAACTTQVWVLVNGHYQLTDLCGNKEGANINGHNVVIGVQHGSANRASQQITGSGDSVTTAQNGNGNSSGVNITGNGNIAVVSQTGNGGWSTVGMSGNGGTVFATQGN